MLYARVYVCMASVEMTDVLSMHMHPHGGITAPFETDVYIDSTAPATRNRLRLGFVENMFCCLRFGHASRAYGLVRLLGGM